MPRIMAFDYGKKRVGIAVSDPLKIVANSLQTVSTKEIKAFVESYLSKEEVETFVVGIPMNPGYEQNPVVRDIELFIVWLKNRFPDVNIQKIDERFTSKLAQQTILMSGANKKKRQEKTTVDKVSATIILQCYMEMAANHLI